MDSGGGNDTDPQTDNMDINDDNTGLGVGLDEQLNILDQNNRSSSTTALSSSGLQNDEKNQNNENESNSRITRSTSVMITGSTLSNRNSNITDVNTISTESSKNNQFTRPITNTDNSVTIQENLSLRNQLEKEKRYANTLQTQTMNQLIQQQDENKQLKDQIKQQNDRMNQMEMMLKQLTIQSTLRNTKSKDIDYTNTEKLHDYQKPIDDHSNIKNEPESTYSNIKIDAKKPDTFHGDNKTDVEKWVRQLEIYQRLARTSDTTKVDHALMYLKDQALDWALIREFESFGEFKTALLNRFGSREKSLKAAKALDRANQLTTVENYTKYFQQKINELSGKHVLDDSEQVRKFRQGLKPEIQQLMIGSEFDNLDAVIHRAVLIEENLKLIISVNNSKKFSTPQQNRTNNNNGNNTKNNRSNYTNYDKNRSKQQDSSKSGQVNNTQQYLSKDDEFNLRSSFQQDESDANADNKENQENSSSDQSYLQSLESFAKKNNKSVDEIETLRKQGKCYKCGEFGHLVKNCPQRQSKN